MNEDNKVTEAKQSNRGNKLTQETSQVVITFWEKKMTVVTLVLLLPTVYITQLNDRDISRSAYMIHYPTQFISNQPDRAFSEAGTGSGDPPLWRSLLCSFFSSSSSFFRIVRCYFKKYIEKQVQHYSGCWHKQGSTLRWKWLYLGPQYRTEALIYRQEI